MKLDILALLKGEQKTLTSYLVLLNVEGAQISCEIEGNPRIEHYDSARRLAQIALDSHPGAVVEIVTLETSYLCKNIETFHQAQAQLPLPGMIQ